MAIINGHFDLAKLLIERGADVKLASDNGATPLYATLNVQWAPKALYPQPRAYTQQKTVAPRADEGAHRQGRRRQRAPEDEGVVLGLQLRPRRRRRDRRDAVLARGLRQRRRRDEAAGGARRRSDDPVGATGRPAAHRRRRPRERAGRVGPAAGSGRWPRRHAAAGRIRRRLRRGLRRQLPSLRAGRHARRGQVSRSRSSAPTSTRAITRATPRCITPRRAATSR